MKRIFASLSAVALMACAAQSQDEELSAQSSAIGIEQRNPPPSSSGESSLSLRWAIAEGVLEQDAEASLELRLDNHEDEWLNGKISIEIIGLGAQRIIDLGTMELAPNSAVTLPWAPANSPIAPVGTTARLYARVAFEREGVGVRAPAQILSLAFSEDGKKAYLSATDDTGVRLASLGRASAGAQKHSLTNDDKRALLSNFHHRKGKLDGTEAPPLEIPAAGMASPRAESRWADTLAFPGELNDNLEAFAEVEPSNLAPIPPPVLSPCPQYSFRFTTPVCAKWAPEGFRDIGVSSSVPSEDYDLEGPAAYANAAVFDGNTFDKLIWAGRLDHNGCTPPVTYCTGRLHTAVSTSSLQIPDKPGPIPLFASREFVITPAATYGAGISFDEGPNGQFSAIATVRSPDYPVRVASAVSRILTMRDNGVPLALSSPPLVIHTENGCSDWPEFEYSPGQFGEACAGPNDAWFGPALKMVNGSYVPTGRHTTEDAYTIGHELGHSMQLAANGGPSHNGYSGPTSGLCSCEHVNDGNRIHCLQSQHWQASAEVEGFAHFYAARIMNDQGSTCRFTYYKNYRKLTVWYPLLGPSFANIAPPAPVDCGKPFVGGYGSNKTQGWVGSFCPQSNKSSEYDWLTFLWAVNGSAASSARSSMWDLYTILGGAGSGSSFTWASVRAQAENHFASKPSKLQRFTDSGELHGVNL